MKTLLLSVIAVFIFQVSPAISQVDECSSEYITSALGEYVLSFDQAIESGQSVDKTLETIQNWITKTRIQCSEQVALPAYTIEGEKGLYFTDATDIEDGEYWVTFTSNEFASFKVSSISDGCLFDKSDMTTLDTMPIRMVAQDCSLGFTYSASGDWTIDLTKVQHD